MMKHTLENKMLRSVLDITKEEANRLLEQHKDHKGLCHNCSYYRPLKPVNGYMVCELCEDETK